MYHSCTVRGKAQKFPASLAEFVPFGDEELKYIFSRDMCVGENTSQAASVRGVAECDAADCTLLCRKRLGLFRQI